MLYLVQAPCNCREARSIGFSSEELALAPEWKDACLTNPINGIGGTLPIPPVPGAYSYTVDDTDEVMKVKQGGGRRLDMIVGFLRGVVDRQRSINRDLRYSDQGRLEANLTEWDKWVEYIEPSVKELPAQFRVLLKEMKKIIFPLPLPDAKAAILDSDYRATVRAMPDEMKRIIYLSQLVNDKPDSPVLLSVLRADPFASAISDDLHSELMMRRAAQAMPDDLRGLWGAAGLLSLVAYMLYEGTRIVGKVASRDATFIDLLEKRLRSPEHVAMGLAIDALIRSLPGRNTNINTHSTEPEHVSMDSVLNSSFFGKI